MSQNVTQKSGMRYYYNIPNLGFFFFHLDMKNISLCIKLATLYCRFYLDES